MSAKASTRLPYYRIRRNRAFFAPGKDRATRAGWIHPDGSAKASIPLGEAGDSAEQEALRLYHQLQQDLGTGIAQDTKQSCKYPRGSFGEFFQKWRFGDVWKTMKPRTRDDYDRVWPRIEERFANVQILDITPSLSQTFHLHVIRLEEAGELSPAERFRTLKIWRALLNNATAMGIFNKAPIGKISNPQAAGSSAFWFAQEIDQLIITARDNGFGGMSLAIWIGWETLMSPCDVRCLSKRRLQLFPDGDGYIDTNRQKTGKQALPYLTADLMSAIREYCKSLERELNDDEPIIRMRSGVPYKDKNTFAKDFRKIRSIAFPDDTRTYKDIRRSGNLEAELGDASAEDRAELLANTLHKSGFLEATYTPPTVTRGKKIRDNRATGRNLLKAEKEAKSRNDDEK